MFKNLIIVYCISFIYFKAFDLEDVAFGVFLHKPKIVLSTIDSLDEEDDIAENVKNVGDDDQWVSIQQI